jgi:hypothetical protein
MVAPLMVRALPLFEMVLSAPLDGTMLAHEPLRDTEITQRIKDTTEVVQHTRDAVADDLEFVYLIPGHRATRSDVGFIEFISFFGFLLCWTLDPTVLVLRAGICRQTSSSRILSCHCQSMWP